jgi:hypothetical protein
MCPLSLVYNSALAGEPLMMMSILRRIREKLFGNDGRAKNRSIKRECATLRRWSERGQGDRFNV